MKHSSPAVIYAVDPRCRGCGLRLLEDILLEWSADYLFVLIDFYLEVVKVFGEREKVDATSGCGSRTTFHD